MEIRELSEKVDETFKPTKSEKLGVDDSNGPTNVQNGPRWGVGTGKDKSS
jgi:hypothetical protein